MEELETLLWEIVELVKQTAPEVWRIAMTQAYAEAAAFITVVVLGLGVGFGLIVLARHYVKQRGYWDDVVPVFSIVGALAALVAAAIALPSAIMHIISPEYYAIKILMRLAGLGGC